MINRTPQQKDEKNKNVQFFFPNKKFQGELSMFLLKMKNKVIIEFLC